MQNNLLISKNGTQRIQKTNHYILLTNISIKRCIKPRLKLIYSGGGEEFVRKVFSLPGLHSTASSIGSILDKLVTSHTVILPPCGEWPLSLGKIFSKMKSCSTTKTLLITNVKTQVTCLRKSLTLSGPNGPDTTDSVGACQSQHSNP